MHTFVLETEVPAIPPTEFKIVSIGELALTQDNKPTTLPVTEEMIDKIIAFADNQDLDIPIDYNHEAYFRGLAEGKDEIISEQSPAAGWFRLEKRGTELWANVKNWTEKATGYLEDRAYKYFSPVIRGLDNGNYRLSSLGLTNIPAINKQTPLVAQSENGTQCAQSKRKADMLDLKPILEALELQDVIVLSEDGAKDEDLAKIVGKIQALKALATAAPDVAVLQSELAELKLANETNTRKEMLKSGLAEGKLTAKMAEDFANTDVLVLQSLLANIPTNSMVNLGASVDAAKLPVEGEVTTSMSDEIAAKCNSERFDEEKK